MPHPTETDPNPLETEEVDASAITHHFDAIWGPHDWPKKARLAVCLPAGGGMKTVQVEMDPDALVGALTVVNRTSDVWIGVAPHPLGTRGRGTAQTALGLPALVADIDTADGQHKPPANKGLQLPTRDDAKALITQFPVGRPLVIDSGGGYHVWLPLTEVIDHRSPEGAAILARWKRWWVEAFHEAGFLIDECVLADAARILRPAGTVSRKIPDDHRPVRFARRRSIPASLDALDADLPQLPLVSKSARPHPRRATPASASAPRSPDRAVGDSSPDEDTRPGSALGVAVPVSVLLEQVFGWECRKESADVAEGEVARWWSPDGAPEYPAHAATYADEGRGETVTVFDVAAQEAWHIPEATEGRLDEHGIPLAPNQHRWTSWDVLGHVICQENWGLAGRIAAAHPTADSLVELLRRHPHLEALEAMYPDPTAVVLGTALSDALEARDGRPVPVGTATFAIVGGSQHGLQKREQVPTADGGFITETTQILDWIAYRPQVTVYLRINERFVPEVIDGERYTVTVLTKDGRSYTRSGLPASEACSHRSVILSTNAPAELPSAQSHRVAADNMLILLGRSEQEEVRSYTSMGWAMIDGHPTYLCPNGSITPDGVTTAYTVGPSAGSEESALTAAMRATGFSGADMPIDQAIKAIDEFTAIAPHRPELTIAALGLIFSAPLHLQTRAVVVIAGESDSGKTLFSGAVQSWLSDIPRGAKNASSLYIPSSSPVAATNIMSWYRDATCVADDYRRSDEGGSVNARVAEVLQNIVQAGYGAASSGKATRDGGLRGARDQAASALITAEVTADQTAIRTRSITVPLRRADGITEVGGALDKFLEGSAINGAARSVMAAYVRFLARKADEMGLPEMAAEMQQRAHDAYARLSGRRNAETVAALLVGWEVFREFADSEGVEDRLPTSEDVMEALQRVASENATGAALTDPGRRVIEHLSDMVWGNQGHLVDHLGNRPVVNGVSPGWQRVMSVSDSQSGGTTERWDPKGLLIGRISEDQRYVVVGKAAIHAAMRGARVDGLAPAQVYEALERYHQASTQPGKRVPVSLGIVARPDGFVIDAEVFGIARVPTDEAV